MMFHNIRTTFLHSIHAFEKSRTRVSYQLYNRLFKSRQLFEGIIFSTPDDSHISPDFLFLFSPPFQNFHQPFNHLPEYCAGVSHNVRNFSFTKKISIQNPSRFQENIKQFPVGPFSFRGFRSHCIKLNVL